MSSEFNYGGSHLTIGICLDIASGKTRGIISSITAEKVRASWREVEKIVHKTFQGILYICQRYGKVYKLPYSLT